MKRPLLILIGTALLAAPATANANYRDGHWYVHHKRVFISKRPIGGICCPNEIYYRIRWGTKVQGYVSFPCANPHAKVVGAEPAPFDRHNMHKGIAYFLGCKTVVKKHKLRD